MRKCKRFLLAILCLVLMLASVGFVRRDLDDNLISYVAKLLGVAPSDVCEIYDECETMNLFLDEVDIILSDIVKAEQWDCDEKNIADLEELANEVGVDETILQRHINICGTKYFMRRVCASDVSLLGGDSGTTTTPITENLFMQFYDTAHTGNIFLTKDSVDYNYRHGHCGIVSSYWYETEDKTIVEALGDKSVVADEIQERPLDCDYWKGRVTLAIYYPEGPTNADDDYDSITAAERESAGRYAHNLENSQQCIYQTFVIKGRMDDIFPKMNCISLINWCYLQAAGYDLTPQTSNGGYLYPSHIQFSPIIRLKTMSGGVYRTSNWNSLDWGWE